MKDGLEQHCKNRSYESPPKGKKIAVETEIRPLIKINFVKPEYDLRFKIICNIYIITQYKKMT